MILREVGDAGFCALSICSSDPKTALFTASQPHKSAQELQREGANSPVKFGEKRVRSCIFLDLAKVFYTVLVDSLLYKLMVLNFLSYMYLVKSSSSCTGGRSKCPSKQSYPLVECGLAWFRVESFSSYYSVSISR